jgi:NAD(P)-dependent dehydrogenase (short-subunit alcohol dehydrogenase family)
MDELRFDGRVAVVTGAARGIGRAHALLLASRGASVVVADFGGGVDGAGAEHGPADEVVAEIQAAGGTAVACYASVADERQAASIVDTALESFGRLDIVVNNAGIHDPGPFAEQTVESFRRMLDVHFWGTLYVCKAAWGPLVDSGYGRIVNTLSEAMFGFTGEIAYAAGKGASLGLTMNLALEGPAHGIRVNAIAPRAHTRMTPANVPDDIRQMMPPDLVAPAVAYLAHESCELNGEILVAGLGGVNSIFITYNTGIQKAGLTLEDVAENIETITDRATAFVPDTSWARQE